MAKSDILVRWKADTSNYDANIAKAKRQLEGFTQANYSAGGVMKQFTGELVAVAARFASMGAAAAAAGKVMKDTFSKNEQNLDEWGRVVQSTQDIYEGFLNALNTGDIGGFLSNMDRIVQAARDAYDAIDELNTYNAFNQVNVERTRAEMTQAIADYRSGTGSKAEAKAAGEAYKKELAERQRMEQDAYEASIRELAAKRGVDAGLLRKAMSGTYGQYQDLKKTQMTGRETRYQPGLPGQPGRYYEAAVPANEAERLGQVLRQLNDTELQALQALGAQAQRTGNEMATVDRQMARVMNGRGAGGGSSKGVTGQGMDFSAGQGIGIRVTESMNELNTLLQQWQANLAAATNAAAAGEAEAMIANLKARIDAQPLAIRLGLDTQTVVDIKQSMDETIASWTFSPIELTVNTKGAQGLNDIGRETKSTWKDAAGAVSSLGSALQSLEDPGAKVAGIIGQAIANVALSFSSAMKGSATVWDWIAGAIAGTATMISTIASIKSATAGAYAEGGVVGGNSTAGDRLYARVNSGETILTRLQAERVTDALDASPMATGANFGMVLRGEDLISAIVNTGSRQGRRGEKIFIR